MLLGLLFRIITGFLAFLGFVAGVIWIVFYLTGHSSMFDRLPTVIGVFLIVCVLCFGAWDAILSWKKPGRRASDDKPPKI